MKKTELGREVDRLYGVIEECYKEITYIQTHRCKHTNVKKTLVSNYSYKEPLEELDECYSVECLNCRRSWNEQR